VNLQPAGNQDHGIVVMAYGSRRYQAQARSLARSLDHNSPGIPRTLITDQPDSPAAAHYENVIPLAGPTSRDCRPKLDLDQYTVYRRTLYIDADSLVMRPLAPLFARLQDHDFTVIGRNITSGHWYGDVTSMCRLAGSPSIPMFNGGLLYFADTNTTHRVFAHARELADRYLALRFDRFNGGIADEPLLAIALAAERLHAHDLTQTAMASLLGATGPLSIDVLNGRCDFQKRGRPVAPSIVHFAADHSSRRLLLGAHYRRECLALALVDRLHLPWQLARSVGIGIHGLLCVLANHAHLYQRS
jgi:hypothetical protein